ncbi:hypothetical protein COW98_00675 [Candidatus Roizmanbacteria bacterium CG22_combo_CG10-13_8_21_14_all_35_9]|uniref:Cell division protein FtsX n=4 Tax=Candidatus Roizmaniibacteriota TaxID=1752723 RepID=A0A2M8F2N6_9BACT|nr:MAG: hypothetical protein COX47_03565 [Candidatus Roizmanbacteria bacterium CG23_combo_of_CG06-09_8_20_14_all_35_49]PIP63064.1 MAG: hypothetical protein COW98_00675 [Candidatus Roizmanbacteria bacterium CG22_combo_CG10-13_8_21_14_all_35_9]PIY71472.1 MAG: hypothetical protein COY88_00115 [Candidatus Roizmanbacteria bacterium CG_4_10_14_0_8_um_filter_35_28]PJC33564.1 MAG: hypothetical protein CO048_02820 [Candidatus Roizmanbacteria bacterium CG_4_9_14_0_2_um_filter_35_15]PJC82572.1 MAG: hypoth
MKELFTSIKRAPYQTLTAFLVLFLTLFLSMILFVSLTFLHGVLGYLESRPQVTVYFQTSTPEKEIFKIRDELNNSGKVILIKYISQQEAFNIYKNINKNDPLLLEMVSADILPSSLEIYAKKPVYLPEIAEFLKKQGGVDEVQFQKDIVDRLLNLTNVLRKLSLLFFVYLLLMSTIVLTTTTLFKIALKKDEIELMRLIGASNFYIRKPFLQEGVFLGLVASLVSFIILLLIFFYLNPFLSSYLKGIPVLEIKIFDLGLKVWPINFSFLIIVFFLSSLFGCFISIISSFLATRKYLKV